MLAEEFPRNAPGHQKKKKQALTNQVQKFQVLASKTILQVLHQILYQVHVQKYTEQNNLCSDSQLIHNNTSPNIMFNYSVNSSESAKLLVTTAVKPGE